MTAQLDHLVHAVADLDAAVEELADSTGVRPAPGGSHPGRGTRNALVGLSVEGVRRSYLELLAPDPAQPDVPDEDLMIDLGSALGRTPVLHAWAIRPDHLRDTLSRGRSAGLDLGEPVAASRELPDGTVLSWELAVPRPLGLDGLQPFLIDWTGGAHPTDADLPTVELVGLTLRHPDPDVVERMLETLGARDLVEVRRGDVAGLDALLHTPRGEVVLAGRGG